MTTRRVRDLYRSSSHSEPLGQVSGWGFDVDGLEFDGVFVVEAPGDEVQVDVEAVADEGADVVGGADDGGEFVEGFGVGVDVEGEVEPGGVPVGVRSSGSCWSRSASKVLVILTTRRLATSWAWGCQSLTKVARYRRVARWAKV